MKVVIAGGSGFIGTHLAQTFLDQDLVVLSRNPNSKLQAPNSKLVEWNADSLGPWVDELEGAEALINLSGKPIAVRHTPENKHVILESRVAATQVLGEAVRSCKNPPKCWINASAIGYYGDGGDDELNEDSAPGNDFLSAVTQRWEEAFFEGDVPSRRAALRIGLVLGRDGGALAPLVKVANLGLGGSLGSGRQWVSWIHVDDLVSLFRWCVTTNAEGVYNATAPNPVRNAEFMRTLRQVLKRPWAPPAPEFALKLMAKLVEPDPSLALISSRVLPLRAVAEGFQFQFPSLPSALQDLLT